MTKTSFASVVALALLMSATVAQAQSTKKSKENTRAKAATVVKAARALPFTPTFWQADVSPLKYLSNTSEKTFKWVESWVKEQSKALPKKPDSFSTNAERAEYTAALAETTKSTSPLPLELECTKNYNVEKQFYEVEIVAFPLTHLALKDKRFDSSDALDVNREVLLSRKISIPGDGDTKKTGTYIAQNAFGASVTVSKYQIERFFLAVTAGPANEPQELFVDMLGSGRPYGMSDDSYKLRVPVPSSQAREIDKDIACLGVLSLSVPAAVYGVEVNKATRDDPNDAYFSYYGIVGKLDHILVFNKTTGEVYAKASRSGL